MRENVHDVSDHQLLGIAEPVARLELKTFLSSSIEVPLSKKIRRIAIIIDLKGEAH
jgi:hypothetical protein